MNQFGPWVVNDMTDINRALRELTNTLSIRSGYSGVNYTQKRTLDKNTAVLADVVNVLCTLIEDLKRNGGISA